jgi:magnesium transporter
MIIDCAVYEDGHRQAGELALDSAYEASRRDNAFVWIGLFEPTEEEFDAVRREFALHELAVEDAINAHQRPKLEMYDDTLFVVLKTCRYVEAEERVELGEIMLFIGDGFVVSVRHGTTSELHGARLSMEKRPDLLGCGPGAVLYTILDRVVDDYEPVVAGIDAHIEEVERDAFKPSENPTERIYSLEREVLELRRGTMPLCEAVDRLARGRFDLIDNELRSYFRDVHDHLLRITDRIESFRDQLASVLQANLIQVTVRQNEDMRKISAWLAIVAVPALVTGVYGMNFNNLPGGSWRFGFPIALVGMLVVCAGLFRYFRRAGWL